MRSSLAVNAICAKCEDRVEDVALRFRFVCHAL